MNFDAWDFKTIQGAYSILAKMDKHGVQTIADASHFLKKYMVDLAQRQSKERKAAMARPTRTQIPSDRCEKCGGPVYIEPVNVSRCTRTGDRSRTAVICYDPDCSHVKYTKKMLSDFATRMVDIMVDRHGKVRITE